MSKGMSANLETVAQGAELIARMLVTIYAPDQTFRFVANDNADLTMPNGDIYVAAQITRGEISSSTDGDKEQVALTLSNRWKEWASYLANNGKALKGRRCVIEDVFLDHLDEGAVWRFEGTLDGLGMTISEFTCKVTRDVIDYSVDAPAVDFGPTCQWTFGDSRCRSAAAGPCDQTLNSCAALGNITRFGGHPSIPLEMVIRV